jgi:hypothetical protein
MMRNWQNIPELQFCNLQFTILQFAIYNLQFCNLQFAICNLQLFGLNIYGQKTGCPSALQVENSIPFAESYITRFFLQSVQMPSERKDLQCHV